MGSTSQSEATPAFVEDSATVDDADPPVDRRLDQAARKRVPARFAGFGVQRRVPTEVQPVGGVAGEGRLRDFPAAVSLARHAADDVLLRRNAHQFGAAVADQRDAVAVAVELAPVDLGYGVFPQFDAAPEVPDAGDVLQGDPRRADGPQAFFLIGVQPASGHLEPALVVDPNAVVTVGLERGPQRGGDARAREHQAVFVVGMHAIGEGQLRGTEAPQPRPAIALKVARLQGHHRILPGGESVADGVFAPGVGRDDPLFEGDRLGRERAAHDPDDVAGVGDPFDRQVFEMDGAGGADAEDELAAAPADGRRGAIPIAAEGDRLFQFDRRGEVVDAFANAHDRPGRPVAPQGFAEREEKLLLVTDFDPDTRAFDAPEPEQGGENRFGFERTLLGLVEFAALRRDDADAQLFEAEGELIDQPGVFGGEEPSAQVAVDDIELGSRVGRAVGEVVLEDGFRRCGEAFEAHEPLAFGQGENDGLVFSVGPEVRDGGFVYV